MSEIFLGLDQWNRVVIVTTETSQHALEDGPSMGSISINQTVPVYTVFGDQYTSPLHYNINYAIMGCLQYYAIFEPKPKF